MAMAMKPMLSGGRSSRQTSGSMRMNRNSDAKGGSTLPPVEKSSTLPRRKASAEGDSKRTSLLGRPGQFFNSLSGGPREFRLPEQAPRDRGRLTLVLDVDETLVHSKLSGEATSYRQYEERKARVGSCDEFKIVLKSGETVWVNKRPGLDAFLRRVSELYEPIVYTAGLQEYAKPLLNWLDPDGTIFRHRLYRDNCVFQKGHYVKDLSKCNRDLNRIVLVDNNAMCFLPQLRNGIPISSFYDDPNDSALSVLETFLERLQEEPDVRPFLDKSFDLKNLLAKHKQQIMG